jgi:flagellin-specific chaperone FliS
VFSAATNKYLQQKGSVDSQSPLNFQFLLIDACFGFLESQREAIKITGIEIIKNSLLK